jgi:hypothetical protein
LFINKKNPAKIAPAQGKAAHHKHKPNTQSHHLCVTNNPGAMPWLSFFCFSFKVFTHKRTLRLSRGSQVVIEQRSRNNYPFPEIPEYVYSKHRRRMDKYKYKNGTIVIDFGNGGCANSLSNGVRMPSILPFRIWEA